MCLCVRVRTQLWGGSDPLCWHWQRTVRPYHHHHHHHHHIITIIAIATIVVVTNHHHARALQVLIEPYMGEEALQFNVTVLEGPGAPARGSCVRLRMKCHVPNTIGLMVMRLFHGVGLRADDPCRGPAWGRHPTLPRAKKSGSATHAHSCPLRGSVACRGLK